jgi:hypothetical protein
MTLDEARTALEQPRCVRLRPGTEYLQCYVGVAPELRQKVQSPESLSSRGSSIEFHQCSTMHETKPNEKI